MSEEIRWIDRPGIFRGTPVEIGIRKSDKSASVALHVMMTVDQWFDPDTKEWQDWRAYNFRAWGDLWVIGKTGSLNENAAETARDVVGWDGNMENPDVGRLNPCQFTVHGEEYKDKITFKIQFFNEWDRVGGSGTASQAEVRQLQSQHGSALRAYFGQKQTKAAPPVGRPASPPPAAARPAPPAPAPAPVAPPIPRPGDPIGELDEAHIPFSPHPWIPA